MSAKTGIEWTDSTWNPTTGCTQIAAAEPRGYGLMVTLTVLTGMREGEVFGLEWRCVDFAERTLTIERPTTKTRKGARTVALDEAIVTRLRAHRMEQMRVFAEPGAPPPRFVFVRPNGLPWTSGSHQRYWEPIREAAGLPDLHFHDLRHIQGTLLARLQVNAKVAQERLGHANVATTLGIYSHVNVEDQRGAADVVAEMLGLGQS